jgi:hypothetical protein
MSVGVFSFFVTTSGVAELRWQLAARHPTSLKLHTSKIQGTCGVAVPTADPSKPAYTHVHFFLCKFGGSQSGLFPWCPGCATSLNYRNLARAKSKGSAAILMYLYCFTRSGPRKKSYSAAGSSSVEIQYRNVRWHFTSRDPLPGPVAANTRYSWVPHKSGSTWSRTTSSILLLRQF